MGCGCSNLFNDYVYFQMTETNSTIQNQHKNSSKVLMTGKKKVQPVLTKWLLFLSVGWAGETLFVRLSLGPAVWLEVLWPGKGMAIFGLWKGSCWDRAALDHRVWAHARGRESHLPSWASHWGQPSWPVWQGHGEVYREHSTLLLGELTSAPRVCYPWLSRPGGLAWARLTAPATRDLIQAACSASLSSRQSRLPLGIHVSFSLVY